MVKKHCDPDLCPCCGKKLEVVIYVGPGKAPVPRPGKTFFADEPANWVRLRDLKENVGKKNG